MAPQNASHRLGRRLVRLLAEYGIPAKFAPSPSPEVEDDAVEVNDRIEVQLNGSGERLVMIVNLWNKKKTEMTHFPERVTVQSAALDVLKAKARL